MPITRRDGKYYWGSKGPFDSRKKAEEVAQAAYASGYQEDTMATVTGTTAGGATMRSMLKEDGGDGGTGFTVETSGYSETYNDRPKKKKKKSGLDRAHDFLIEGTPTLKSLDIFMQKDTGGMAADGVESKNRMNNPRRLDWRKLKKETNMGANRIPTESDPANGLQKVPKASREDESKKLSVVSPRKRDPNLKQQDEHKIAQQKDMEGRAKKWEDERKKVKDNDPFGGPPMEQAAVTAHGFHMMEKAFSGGYYPDALSRGGDKDEIERDEDEKEAEEEPWKFLKELAPNLYKMVMPTDVS